MDEEGKAAAAAPLQPNESSQVDLSPPLPKFDPSRMIGVIRRKALIKDLAAVYHAECLAYCQELLELQRKWEESCMDIKAPEDLKKHTTKRPTKRSKKAR
ncbi:hypothetical protein Nepgr_029543 [Nepenthes gracilis]|uniref:Uncharacterized protein n=1 Tax=Nepenthes gracilis TaxID=150966 RepID=A0AAD3TDS6_NEPGR|nr:hypothetical protein Nepgr_029543 [Nepenthes gracilis]